MKRFLQIFLPIFFLVLAGSLFYYFIVSRPEPRRRGFQTPTPQVETRTLAKTNFKIVLDSQGVVRARTRSTLVPEVRGRIISISENFQEGAFFEKGDVLIELDKGDYQTELIVAKGNLIQAELRLEEERARYEQASQDWARLNPGEEPSSLVLREPQLRDVEAKISAAVARVANANRNLERTRITAPYAGRILTKSVDVGQYVSPGNKLAEIYAVDFAEVRLPLTASQFDFLNLPSVYRGENPALREGPKVVLKSGNGGRDYQWDGRIVRSEGAVDSATRQIFVVAQIENPYGRTKDERPPLKVGAFVEAEIEGRNLEGVFVVPRKLLRENTNILTVDSDDYLNRKTVGVAWQNDDVVVVESGLEEGDRLCLTYVPFALEGWQVQTTEEQVAASDDEKAEVEEVAEVKRRPRQNSGGGGSPLERLKKQLPEGVELPADLKAKFEAIEKSGDFSGIRALMPEVRAWAESKGIELKLGRPGGR